jgi:hypothetical protein
MSTSELRRSEGGEHGSVDLLKPSRRVNQLLTGYYGQLNRSSSGGMGSPSIQSPRGDKKHKPPEATDICTTFQFL